MRPSIDTFVDASGSLFFVRPGERDLVVRAPDAADVAIVDQLARRQLTLAALADGLGVDRETVAGKLASLVDAGVVLVRCAPDAAPLSEEDAERFSRQLPYLAELGDELALQRRLHDATIAVLGCGGLGTWAVAALASAGVRNFVLVDHDVVELSNLNRQILYRRDDVGETKVRATAAWLRAFDPAIQVRPVERRIETEDDVPPVIDGADAVILAADWPPYELARWVNVAAIALRTPFVVAGQVPPILKVGPAYVPGETGCFNCHEAALRRASAAYDDYVLSRRTAPSVASTLGPASGVVGTLIGLEVMHLLVGQRPASHGAALLIDMRTLDLRRETIDREPGCPLCEDLQR